MSYSTEERIFMVCEMIKNNEQVIRVQRKWKLEINQHPPTHNTIWNTYRRFKKTGSVHDAERSGRPSTSSENVQEIKKTFEENKKLSIRKASKILVIPYSTIQKTLKAVGMKSFHITMVQRLQEDDKAVRHMMCEGILECMESQDSYLDKILFTDEATFYVNGTVNRHNCRIWGYENPHETMESSFLSPKVTVWLGCTKDHIIGPYFFFDTITKDNYLEMLQQRVVPEMELKGIQQNVIFQQDRAPPHWGLNVRSFLNEKFPNRWWGRDGPITWSPRSPDLSPLDYFVWGYLRNQVYSVKIKDLNHLTRRIKNEISLLHESDMIKNSILSLPKRCQMCIEQNGSHFENILK